MLLNKSDLLTRYKAKHPSYVAEAAERLLASSELKKFAAQAPRDKRFDVFLSHSYHDARVIQAIYDLLTERGYVVYVDWIEDPAADRSNVTPETAALLRYRMASSASLIYATSEAASKSKWMPWELGYMDARTTRVCVAPVLDTGEDFGGREYLGLYPYLDLSGSTLYVHRNVERWVRFEEWQRQGATP